MTCGIYKITRSHNPYFNRWFSAMLHTTNKKSLIICHNPYFNRWFSAIIKEIEKDGFTTNSHNPYFNRWFSAMCKKELEIQKVSKSQSLF